MKKIQKVLLVLFISIIGFISVQSQAEASVKVTFNNRRSQKVSVSLIYYDVQEGSWCCRGWWNVKPHSRRTIHVSHHPKKRIYYYVESKGKAIYKRSEGWARRDIISNAFKYYKYEECPDGKRFRSAYFNCSPSVTTNSWTLNLN